jgi:hypothetical protein
MLTSIFAGLEPDCNEEVVLIHENSNNFDYDRVEYVKIDSYRGDDYRVYRNNRVYLNEDPCCEANVKSFGRVVSLDKNSDEVEIINLDENMDVEEKSLKVIGNPGKWEESNLELEEIEVKEDPKRVVNLEIKEYTQRIIKLIHDCFN